MSSGKGIKNKTQSKSMNHQDWNPIVIHGKTTPPKREHREVTREQKLDREELGTHKKVSHSMGSMIQQGRIAKGFKTQKDLALAVGVNVSIINAYESGRAIPDPSILQKLRRILGVKL
jgi:putative transcription factor